MHPSQDLFPKSQHEFETYTVCQQQSAPVTGQVSIIFSLAVFFNPSILSTRTGN